MSIPPSFWPVPPPMCIARGGQNAPSPGPRWASARPLTNNLRANRRVFGRGENGGCEDWAPRPHKAFWLEQTAFAWCEHVCWGGVARWKLNPRGGWKFLWRARSPLYRSRCLRPNTHFQHFLWLNDLRTFAPLRSQNFSKNGYFGESIFAILHEFSILQNFGRILMKTVSEFHRILKKMIRFIVICRNFNFEFVKFLEIFRSNLQLVPIFDTTFLTFKLTFARYCTKNARRIARNSLRCVITRSKTKWISLQVLKKKKKKTNNSFEASTRQKRGEGEISLDEKPFL